MILDIMGIGILLLLVELGRRKGLLVSTGLLLAFYPLRMISYRLAVLAHDFLISNIRGVLDFKIFWTESAYRGLASSQGANLGEGVRLLTKHPQIRSLLPVEWLEGMDPAFIGTMGGMDRLSDLNLIQVEAFSILMIMLIVFFMGTCRLAKASDLDRAGRLGGAVVLSLLGLLVVYQALVAAAPSIWMVPDSRIALWMEDSRLIKVLLWNNPLMWN